MTQKARILGAVLCAILGLGTLALADNTATVTDLAGRTVNAPFNPQRIIALSSGTLRLITYLQATDKVVGIEDFEKARPFARPYIMAHPELTKLPRIGPGGPGSINKEPDMEAVLQIKPDVIFISYMEAANADALQKKLGIPVVVLSHGRFASFDELVYESLKVAGKILGKEQRAQEVIQFIEQRRNELSSLVKDVPDEQKPEVYVGAIGYKGVQGIESTDASYTPLEWIRAKNMAKRIASGQHLFIDKEKLLQLNPPIIFIDGGGLQLVKQDYEKKPEFYKGLKAFQEHKVYVLYPFNYYVTNVDTAIVDAYAAGRILYPERFAGVDVAKKADEIYTFLVGKPVYKDMEKDFGPIGAEAMFVK
ncbi:MAG: iron ABC transporter substrate-binding protein [Desulfomonilaceae bacterium]